MSGRTTPSEERPDASGLQIAIVAARFNGRISERLVEGARVCLTEHGAPEPDQVWVPGAFELPPACRALALAAPPADPMAAAIPHAAPRRRYDAIVALGCVIRGETAHFDFVAGEAARGLMDVQVQTGTPIGFGVLTTEDEAQADARAGGALGNKGHDAALAAIHMAILLRRLR